MGALDLLDGLVFYGSYHNNKWNQLIHFVFVPAILWSVLVWLALLGPLLPLPPAVAAAAGAAALPAWAASGLQLNAACLAVACYAAFYLLLDPLAGASWACCVGAPLWLSAGAFAAAVPRAGLWALGVHVLGWYMQIHPGHAVLEGRKPALLDSLVQALTLAPLFVWFELLFLLGYRPALRSALQQRVDAEIAAHRAAQARKRA